EYRDLPKTNVYVATLGGVSATTLSDDVYNYMALEAGKIFSLPTIGPLGVGLRHRLLQSDEALDLNSTSAFVHRPFVLSQLAAGEIYYDQSVELGWLLANGYALEWGATAQLGYRNKDYQVALTATKSNLLTSLGAGLGIRL